MGIDRMSADEIAEKSAQVTALVVGGLSRSQAIKQVGISTSTYYRHTTGKKSKSKKKRQVTIKTYDAKPVSTPTVKPSVAKSVSKLIALVGTTDDVIKALGALK